MVEIPQVTRNYSGWVCTFVCVCVFVKSASEKCNNKQELFNLRTTQKKMSLQKKVFLQDFVVVIQSYKDYFNITSLNLLFLTNAYGTKKEHTGKCVNVCPLW